VSEIGGPLKQRTLELLFSDCQSNTVAFHLTYARIAQPGLLSQELREIGVLWNARCPPARISANYKTITLPSTS
jgi:hypothetical protein